MDELIMFGEKKRGKTPGKTIFVQRSNTVVVASWWWGCMAESGVGNSHFIEVIMNKNVYANGLREYLKIGAEMC